MSRTETVTLTNMCMVTDAHGNVLVQDRTDKNWPGLVFPGGHVEAGESFTESVIREVYEETGITGLKPLSDAPVSVEVLHVIRHIKRGKPVPSHVHLNVTYALEADDAQEIHIKPDENSRVGWLDIAEIPQHVTEPTMIPVYHKILSRILGRSAF